MAKGKAKQLSAWDELVERCQRARTRYRPRRYSSTPILQMQDLGPYDGPGYKAKRTMGSASGPIFSTGRLRWNDDADLARAWEAIEASGEDDWQGPTRGGSQSLPSDWQQVVDLCLADWPIRMKAGSVVGIACHLRRWASLGVPMTAAGLEGIIRQESPRPETGAFKRRVETISQIRKSLKASRGEAGAAWIPERLIESLYEDHHNGRRATTSAGGDQARLRGIPTPAELERYLDALPEGDGLMRWVLATQAIFGLRNHELWHLGPIEAVPDRRGVPRFEALLPGKERTKSKLAHRVFAVRPDWVERYGLERDRERYQGELHSRRPPVILMHGSVEPWEPENDKGDPGRCVNNRDLGEWLGDRWGTLARRLPLLAAIPEASGRWKTTAKRRGIDLYDLRHFWAIHVAILPEWQHLSDDDAARAMGHDAATHRQHYQRWLSDEARLQRGRELPADPLAEEVARLREEVGRLQQQTPATLPEGITPELLEMARKLQAAGLG